MGQMRVIRKLLVLLLSVPFAYSEGYVSIRIGGQHQVGKIGKKPPQVFASSKDEKEEIEKRKEDYLEIIEKIYESFLKNVKAMKSVGYHLVSPEVTFSGIFPLSGNVDGGFGEDLLQYEWRKMTDGADASIENHIPEAEARITKIFSDMAGCLQNDVPDLKVDSVKGVEIPGNPGNTRWLKVSPVYATYSDQKFKVIYGSGPQQNGEEKEGIPPDYFANATTLHYWILERYVGGFLRNYPILQKEAYEKKLENIGKENEKLEEAVKMLEDASPPELPSNPKASKLNMFLEGSFGWRKIIANKGSRFGLYTGIELFFDFNPNEMHFDNKQCSLKEHAIGITPFLGIASKENWMLYGLAGVKLSFKRVDVQRKSLTKHKPEFELGAGTDYMLTKHVAMGFRYVHTFQSKMNLKYGDNSKFTLKTHSSKFLLTFSYMF